ncbi:MAG: efflux RND transporter periplasmic adaptor subunit [Pseudomonadota bacterium]
MSRLSPLFACLLILAGCDESTSGTPSTSTPSVKVVTQPVSLQPVTDRIQALGTARANESIEIRPRIASYVTRIAFEEGQSVDQGQLLVELENSEIVAGLELAKAALTESRSLYERSQSLASTQAISASNLEELLAQVKVDEAQVEAARARLTNTRIYAPFAGRVGLRNISPGSFVDSQTVITTLDDTDTIKLDFSVPETFLTVIGEGMNVVAESIVYPDASFTGIVQSIDTRLDPISRSVQARAEIDNRDGRLKPGMFMTVDLRRERGDQIVAPEQSIVPEGEEQFVFVVTDGVVEKRVVTLGRRIPGLVVIENGLDAGELIITEGTGRVRDGSVVESVDKTTLSLTQQSLY